MIALLNAGVPTISINKRDKVDMPDPAPRPEWVSGDHGDGDGGTVGGSGEEIVSLRGLAAMFMS